MRTIWAHRRVLSASLVGTAVEFYDFYIYATAASLVFGPLFFPSSSPAMQLMASYASFAVAFFARPLGAAVFGHYGDRIGRKSTLVVSLMLMGGSTLAIAFLPTYASIGFWAPLLLCLMRFGQGFGLGGEWGGAVLMAVEHAPSARRGFYSSWPQIGVPIGLLTSTLVFSLISRLPEAEFLRWGWRVAFLISIVLVAVGLFIRMAVVEPPAFTAIKEAGNEARVPIFETLRRHPRGVLIAIGARFADNVSFYLYTVFILTFATQPHIGFSKSTLLNAISLAAAFEVLALPAYGLLSDFVGRRPVYLFGAILTGVMGFPFFWLIETGRSGMLTLALFIVLVIAHAAMYGPQASFFSELFGTRVRYTGVSLGYQLSSVLAGGLSPLIATELLRRTGKSWPVALYIVGAATISTISVLVARETAHETIEEPALKAS